LVFVDGAGLGAALVARLRAGGAEVVSVVAGESWSSGPGWVVMDPGSVADHRRLVSLVVGEDGVAPDRVVYCWTVDELGAGVVVPGSGAGGGFAAVRVVAFDALVLFAQAWNGRGGEVGSVRLWVVSNGLHSITELERLAPVKGLLLGPCRVIPREFPGMSCVSVDVELPSGVDGGGVWSRLVDQLVAECGVEPDGVPVAYRGSRRWRQRFVRHGLPVVADGEGWVAGGPVLITGGVGGLGLALARHLAVRWGSACRLVLTSRSVVPPESQWDAVVAAGGSAAAMVSRLRELQGLGAQVLVCQADVADAAAMWSVVEQARDRFGRLGAVVHAAGVAGGGLIQVKDLGQAHEVLRPKVQGLLVLDEIVEAEGVATVVLFSSNAANMGDFGQVDYCAANAVLDAYAYAGSRRRRVVSIDWASWREVGMAVTTQVPEALARLRQADLDVAGMEPGQALDAFDRVLSFSDVPQVVVSPIDVDELWAQAFRLTGDAGQLAVLPAATTHPRPELAVTFTPPRTRTQQAICAVWQDTLGIDRVGIDDSFFELGGNSLIAIQLIAAVNARLGTQLTVARLYEVLSVAGLAVLIDGLREEAEQRPNLLEESRQRTQQRREYQRERRASRGR
jgi:NAD(P)-dependent dehydrogenase (short-subunit alcohol dehydrogenase family)/acyl carrier protein